MRRLNALYPNFCHHTGIAEAFLNMSETMQGPDLKVRLFVNSSHRDTRRPITCNTISPTLARLIPRHTGGAGWVARRTLHRCCRASRPGDVGSLWPGVTLDAAQRLRDKGVITVMEMTNAHRGATKSILDAAYEELGWPATHDISAPTIAEQHARFEAADWIFSPGESCTQSLLDHGIDAEKILVTSRGWSPLRFQSRDASPMLPPAAGVTVLIVGQGCVRKGMPWLLRAWRRAGIKGRLVHAGYMDREIADHCAELLARDDVVTLGPVDDICPVYNTSDIFVLPSLEEGGPKVTYEAMACGLPCIVTPPGAGHAVRHETEGVIVAPRDEGALVDALRRMAEDVTARQRMGEAARRRAAEFEWREVGRRRREVLLRALST